MIRLGLRLAVAGGKEAITRLALIAVAVAIGSALLLTTLASTNAFRAQNQRYAWLETGYPGARSEANPTASTQSDPLWWQLQGDMYNGSVIARVDVAATGPNSPIPPGIPSLPGQQRALIRCQLRRFAPGAVPGRPATPRSPL